MAASGISSWFTKKKTNVRSMVVTDLVSVREKVSHELLHIFGSPDVSDAAKGRRLMLLLQQDLLPGLNGKILESKSKRDYHLPLPVSSTAKALGWIVIIGINFSLLFYVYLFAMTQTGSAQEAWFGSFILWFIMDIFFVGTGMVYFIHFLIPSVTMKDIHKIRCKLLDTVEKYKKSLSGEADESNSPNPVLFNVANHLFVSTRVAKLYPHLRESQIILKFSSPWPRQSYNYDQIGETDESDNSMFAVVTRSLGIMMIFLLSGVFQSSYVEDIVTNVLVTGFTGFVFIWHIDLYNMSPLLAVAPFLFIAIVVHFFIYSDRNEMLQSLQRTEKERLSRVAPKFTKETPSEGPQIEVESDDSSSNNSFEMEKNEGISIGGDFDDANISVNSGQQSSSVISLNLFEAEEYDESGESGESGESDNSYDSYDSSGSDGSSYSESDGEGVDSGEGSSYESYDAPASSNGDSPGSFLSSSESSNSSVSAEWVSDDHSEVVNNTIPQFPRDESDESNDIENSFSLSSDEDVVDRNDDVGSHDGEWDLPEDEYSDAEIDG